MLLRLILVVRFHARIIMQAWLQTINPHRRQPQAHSSKAHQGLPPKDGMRKTSAWHTCVWHRPELGLNEGKVEVVFWGREGAAGRIAAKADACVQDHRRVLAI